MSGKVKTFIDRTIEIHGKLNGKVGGAFTSAGHAASGTETTLLSIIESMLIHGMVIQGRYDNEHYGAVSLGTPGKDEIESCRELGMQVALLVNRMKGKSG
jgi:NAD(P)H dehydrogenase (quinone)